MSRRMVNRGEGEQLSYNHHAEQSCRSGRVGRGTRHMTHGSRGSLTLGTAQTPTHTDEAVAPSRNIQTDKM